ncbi:MAG: putative 18K peptidoglycan-associated outer membrane lipoprotein Peptidoglycan-associated lipoprotein Outer membrane protein P6 OmpA/MotB [Nitrospira sp.]
MLNQSWTLKLALACLCIGTLGATVGCAKRAVSSAGEQQSPAAAKAAPVETIVPDKIVTFPDHQPAPAPPHPVGSSSVAASGREQSAPDSGPHRAVAQPKSQAGAAALETEPVLTDILFDLDRYTIRTDARSVLDTNALVINDLSGKSVVIEGHCDERGTQAYNLILGEKRAKSTKHYLEDLGIPAAKLKIVSYGEIRPLCHQHEERCWQQNRRAHFTVQ